MHTKHESSRRRFLRRATQVVGAVGLAGAAWPFIASWEPSARARAQGAPVRADLSKLEPGQQITVAWRGKPVWILRRTDAMLDRLPELDARLRDPQSKIQSQQPAYADNAHRSLRPQYFVAVGLCTHLGCVPTLREEIAPDDLGPDWLGGYFCPCHGSRYDLAGRVYKNVPAPLNLLVPPCRFVTDTQVEIGTDPKPA
ncbi:MAG: ubiquinol-cytochrome c reductase iron-sulfur subunit [Gammaproteobacteria bacterium]|nr:ubiquinol-cytochrome c reductase iron-sulfur subunit [Gammaproteobacteria bacterium]